MHNDMESIGERWVSLQGGTRFQLRADVLVLVVLQRHYYPDGLRGRFFARLHIHLRIIDAWPTRGMPKPACVPQAHEHVRPPTHGGLRVQHLSGLDDSGRTQVEEVKRTR